MSEQPNTSDIPSLDEMLSMIREMEAKNKERIASLLEAGCVRWHTGRQQFKFPLAYYSEDHDDSDAVAFIRSGCIAIIPDAIGLPCEFYVYEDFPPRRITEEEFFTRTDGNQPIAAKDNQ